MARPLRLEHAGALWHLTSRGNGRRRIFNDDTDRETFLSLLAEAVDVFGWIVHAYVLMTNHFHLVVETPECTLSRGMKWLNQNHAQSYNRRHRRSGHLFQGRFKGILVEKEVHLLELARYVILNPVRARMVKRPEEYRWSSHRAMLGLDAAPEWLATSWLLGQYAPDPGEARAAYHQFVDEGIGLKKKPWRHLVGQIYLGSSAWVEKMQTLIDAKPRSLEHPRAQRQPMRPGLGDVIDAVSREFQMSRDVLRTARGGRARQLVAHIAWREGLIRQLDIAKAVGVGSCSTVSLMIQRCRNDLESDEAFRELAGRCRASMRRRPVPGTGLPPPHADSRSRKRRGRRSSA